MTFDIPIGASKAQAIGLRTSRYPAGKGLAVLLLLKWPGDEDGPPIEEHPVSVNLTDRKVLALTSPQLPEHHFYAKNWSENEDIYRVCLENGIFEEVGVWANTGFVRAPLCKLTEKGLAWIVETATNPPH